jgi:hydrogenase-4 component B
MNASLVLGVEPLELSLALLVLGAGLGWAPRRRRTGREGRAERARTAATGWSLGCATAAATIILGTGAWHLAACTAARAGAVAGTGTGCVRSFTLLRIPQPVGGVPVAAGGVPALNLTVHIDGLTALFLVMIGFCAGCVGVYSFGWLRDNPLRNTVAGSFNAFLAATVLVIAVNNVFWLFVALELITLGSVDLVRYRGRRHGRSADSRTAVRTYVLVSHIGLICLMAGVLPIVVKQRTLDFDSLRTAGGSPVAWLSFLLVLLGLSIRAGVAPFNFWVPTVHPELPTNTHAMMSAVMLKVPIYLMIRFFFEAMIGPIAWWWGVVVLTLASATAVLTVFYALLSKDLKRALAYHSVENIGIIMAGLGLALLFSDARLATPALRAAAALALLASLYHVINHAVFKTLLFLGTGSIEQQTGEVDPRRLGGLLRIAPWTAGTFLVGAVAIAGLPPLNGFISEWLTVQALFGGQGTYRLPAPVALTSMVSLMVALVALAAAFALTGLAFAKICGEALLGEPRRPAATDRESLSMRAVLVLLALTCLVLGLQPWLLVGWLTAAIAPLGYDVSALHASAGSLTIGLPASQPPHAVPVNAYQATLSTWPLLALVVLPLALTAALRVWRWTRRPVWVGGRPFEPDTMSYPGSAASALLWEPLAVAQPGTREGMFPVAFRLSPRRTVIELTNHMYNRLVALISGASKGLGERLQNGDIRNYLLYVFGAVLLVLLAVIPNWSPR